MLINILVSQYNLQPNLTCSISFVDYLPVGYSRSQNRKHSYEFPNIWKLLRIRHSIKKTVFFYLGFLSRTFMICRKAEERGGYLFNSSRPLSLASQTLRHQTGDFCKKLTSACSQQSDLKRDPLVSKCKLLTTKLCTIFLKKRKLFNNNDVLQGYAR